MKYENEMEMKIEMIKRTLYLLEVMTRCRKAGKWWFGVVSGRQPLYTTSVLFGYNVDGRYVCAKRTSDSFILLFAYSDNRCNDIALMASFFYLHEICSLNSETDIKVLYK